MKKCNDRGNVLFVEGLLKCRRGVEDLVSFGVFGAVDYYVLY